MLNDIIFLLWQLGGCGFGRNQALFSNNFNSKRNILLDIKSRAAEIQTISQLEIRGAMVQVNKWLQWNPFPDRVFKLNTDGSRRSSCTAGVGGLI